MHARNDYMYLLKREQECRAHEAQAADRRVAGVHRKFADRYAAAAQALADQTSRAA